MTDDPRPLVPTAEAADVLRMQPETLERLALSRLVTPDSIDPDGTHWWHIHDLRRQLVAYIDDYDEDRQ